MYNIGRMKTKIRIQYQTISALDENQIAPNKIWIDVGSASEGDLPKYKYCEWVNAHGNELLKPDINLARCPATVKLRYDARITGICRVLKENELDIPYEIISIDNIRDQNQFMEIRVQKMEAG